MLNPIEKFKVAILHLNRDWNHLVGIDQRTSECELSTKGPFINYELLRGLANWSWRAFLGILTYR